jgi:hypothetical protein
MGEDKTGTAHAVREHREAVAVQKLMVERNASVPENKRMLYSERWIPPGLAMPSSRATILTPRHRHSPGYAAAKPCIFGDHPGGAGFATANRVLGSVTVRL